MSAMSPFSTWSSHRFVSPAHRNMLDLGRDMSKPQHCAYFPEGEPEMAFLVKCQFHDPCRSGSLFARPNLRLLKRNLLAGSVDAVDVEFGIADDREHAFAASITSGACRCLDGCRALAARRQRFWSLPFRLQDSAPLDHKPRIGSSILVRKAAMRAV